MVAVEVGDRHAGLDRDDDESDHEEGVDARGEKEGKLIIEVEDVVYDYVKGCDAGDCEGSDEDRVRCLLDSYDFGDEITGHSNDGDEADHLHGTSGREEMAERSVLWYRHDDDDLKKRVALRF